AEMHQSAGRLWIWISFELPKHADNQVVVAVALVFNQPKVWPVPILSVGRLEVARVDDAVTILAPAPEAIFSFVIDQRADADAHFLPWPIGLDERQDRTLSR